MHTLICIECGKIFDPKTARQKYCSRKCKNRKHNREYYRDNENYRKISSKRSATLYIERKKNGLCAHCGKEAIKGKTRCLECKDKANRSNKKFASKVAERRAKIIFKLGGKCMTCGYVGVALEFHHLTKEKDTLLWTQSKNLDELVGKGAIQLLCSNCHIETHYAVWNKV